MDKIFLGHMNLVDVKEFLKEGDTIIVPVGTTEQHGPHLPYLTDMLIPFEVAKRAAKKMGALVAPPIPYGMSQSHIGFPAIVYLSGKTFIQVLEEVALSLAHGGFRRIVFINGHYCNDQPLFVAVNEATANPNLPKGTRIIGLTYWNCMSQKMADKYLSWKAGWHANVGETAAVLAIDEKIVDMDRAVKEWPKVDRDMAAMNVMAQQAGGWSMRSKTGIWGDATKASKEMGEEFLKDMADGIVRTIKNYEKSYARASGKK